MRKILAFTLAISAFSTLALAEESSFQVFDRGYARQGTIKQNDSGFDIYDKSSNRVGHIRDNNVYDTKWERQGTIERGGDTRSSRGNR